MSILWCDRRGVLGVDRQKPAGTLAIATGRRAALTAMMEVRSRHAYDGKTYLLPGVPEADTEDEALAAVECFIDWCSKCPNDGVTMVPFDSIEPAPVAKVREPAA